MLFISITNTVIIFILLMCFKFFFFRFRFGRRVSQALARFQFLAHPLCDEPDHTPELLLSAEHHHPEAGDPNIGGVEVLRVPGFLKGESHPGLPCFAQSQGMLVCSFQLWTQLELIEVEQFQVR